MSKQSIEGMDSAAVLAALFNHTKPFGMGARAPLAHTIFSVADAQKILDTMTARAVTDLPEPGQGYVEPGGGVHTGRYLRGHSLGLVVDQDTVEVGQYDRDNGAGLAEKVLARLRETGELTPA
ncbi:hypothetical protein OG883_42815 [Streptomyces sp. NBC_01142]|uniref:hypothetical protein n=1 Tax=Streptomyces sp. NBC_01142 TaxID=2975865 RepID=UPI00225AD541|nr:hypothetical protein [Streptomyces sp. NBC_01142]MCX4826377.1 hypothetical protein [Streptomyces sp. NBC_01142]